MNIITLSLSPPHHLLIEMNEDENWFGGNIPGSAELSGATCDVRDARCEMRQIKERGCKGVVLMGSRE